MRLVVKPPGEDVWADFGISSAEKEFNVLIDVLVASPEFVVVETAEEWDDEDKPPQPEAGEVFKVPGSIVSIVDRLDDELTRSLQHIDPHTTEYIERLSDEGSLYTSILRSQLYLERLHSSQGISSDESLNRVVMRRLDHVYFKVFKPRISKLTSEWLSLRLPAPAGHRHRRGQRMEIHSLQGRLGHLPPKQGQLRQRPPPSSVHLPLSA